MSNQSAPLRALLKEQLQRAARKDSQTKSLLASGSLIEVPSAGTAVSSAYEQLRNAAEYSEEHLLLQRAIKRFYRLNLFMTNRRADRFGRELVAELVQAGYVPNATIGTEATERLNAMIDTYLPVYGHLREAHVKRETAIAWVLSLLSAEAEALLNPHHRGRATVLFAYQYFLQAIDKDHFMDWPDSGSYELCLYVAVHQALLKSDRDLVRYDLFKLYELPLSDTANGRMFNEQVDSLFSSELTAQLRRVVTRAGAPFRVLKGLIDERPDLADVLDNEERFLDLYRSQIGKEYAQVERRLNHGLIKSIAFIVITKTLIGIGVEVPYDLLVYGAIMWVPLIINLLFPPLYMAALRLGIHRPSAANTKALAQAMQGILYGAQPLPVHIPRRRTISPLRQVLYALLFSLPIALCIALLHKLHFNIVQMIIFFVFFSTASSLGFRLGSQVRELEYSGRPSDFLSAVLDFFYLPFIMVGQWLSRKYNQLNIVARFLDVVIELPLKAVLRLIRQWIRFLDERREELY